jgi:hypothetical protein
MKVEIKPSNGGADAAARIRSSIARIKLRNTLLPLASNDLFADVVSQQQRR